MSKEDRWTTSQIQLAQLIAAEVAAPKGFESRRLAHDYIRRLFVQYNEIFKKLDDFYELCLHPQKRAILRLLLNGLVGRLIELKDELIKFDACEYTFFEDLALDAKKTLVAQRGEEKRQSSAFSRTIWPFTSLDTSHQIGGKRSTNEIKRLNRFSTG